MKKRATKRAGEATAGQGGASRRVRMGDVLVRAGAALRELVIATGLAVFETMLEEDREALCGPAGSWQGEQRTAYRYGYEQGRVVLGGRKVPLSRPRVRRVGGQELALPSWVAMRQEDPLHERAFEQMVVGVSTRKYARSLEELPEGHSSSSVSRSCVSRRFVARTREQITRRLSESLEGRDFPVILVDGTVLGDHVMLVAMGIEADGSKRVLGVVEGSSESEQAGRALLRNLLDRGLVVERMRLFVVDGGKGVRAAIRKTFGGWALIQRCQIHKMRNVLDHLPDSKHAWVRAAIRKAWAAGSAEQARKRLLGLAEQLEEVHPGAAASLREGLEETLTILRLGVSATLTRSLRSTNPIENLNSALKHLARRVKRWRGGTMALRWAVTGILEAEKRFHRIKGYRDLQALSIALDRHAPSHLEELDQEALTA
jgi:putative transposase